MLGAGESAIGAALLGRARGWQVFVSEYGTIKPEYRTELQAEAIAFEEGGHTLERVLAAHCVVKSPGIPETAPVVQAVRQAGIELISEIEFAARYTTGKIIAITGTNGKTTTTRMTHGVLAHAGLDVCMAGNIGNSFARELAQRDYAYWVLEVSSFQLDDIVHFRPHIAVITNLSDNHLNRYGYSLERYGRAKMNITHNQTEDDHFIFSLDSPDLARLVASSTVKARMHGFSVRQPLVEASPENPTPLCAATVESHFILINTEMTRKRTSTRKISLENVKVEGTHNRYNAMAAAIVGDLLSIRNETVRESLEEFENSPHRLEKLGKVNGVEYINDSKATNVNAAWFALESMTAPTIWMVGGIDKGNDYGTLLGIVKEKVKGIVMIGDEVSKIEDSFRGHIKFLLRADSMEEAVKKASEIAHEGDVVLLSPACASFDWYDSYEERGEHFRDAVAKLS
jgi:UDP-N-acetylmuramoylalanine--D-glutamate ligase